ncbi:TrmH family RNA methyltransferase [Candidatus Berkelbacteria bacterium]|nr:TrmH family RNA methyltransferase [Candidatus Berkelbacteria bacterium]
MIKRQSRIIAVLDNIRSLYNVGSIFRTSDAFAIEHLYLCGLTGTPAEAKQRAQITKTSLGAEQTVPWSYAPQAIEVIRELKRDGLFILALEQAPTALSITTYSPPSNAPIALVVGHELYGVSEGALKLANQTIQIPMLGIKESLNVTVAYGIALAHLRQ